MKSCVFNLMNFTCPKLVHTSRMVYSILVLIESPKLAWWYPQMFLENHAQILDMRETRPLSDYCQRQIGFGQQCARAIEAYADDLLVRRTTNQFLEPSFQDPA